MRPPTFTSRLLVLGVFLPSLTLTGGWAGPTPAVIVPGAVKNANQNGIQRMTSSSASHRSLDRQPAIQEGGLGNGHLLIGYWQNFTNEAPPVTLGQVSPQFDIINVAFGTPAQGSTATITFVVDPELESKRQFKADVAALHRAGKKVVLSIGGASATVQLNNAADVSAFVSSVESIVKHFSFDGIDIDFEGGSLTLNSGDADFKNPTTPAVVNLIQALHRLNKKLGSNFIISFAPETLFVQAAVTGYGGQRGCYLPVIFGTQKFLSYVQTQDYNSGTIRGLDGNIYTGGTPDFHVALTEFLLHGFNVAGDPSQAFPALRPGQVAFGAPASPQGASTSPPSYTTPTDIQNALNYLVTGVPFPGHQYTLINPAGYPDMRGLMTWSINWDLSDGQTLSSQLGPFLHSLGSQ